MADTTKKEYTSNLHPKGDLDATVYPNVKCENIIDKDTTTTGYTAGKVPDSSLVQKSLNSISENLETTKIQVDTNKTNIDTLQGDVATLKTDNQATKTTIAGLVSSDTTNKKNIAKNTQNIENLSAVMPTDINVDANGYAILEHDGIEITGQKKQVKFAQMDKNASFSEVTIPSAKDLKIKDGSKIGGALYVEPKKVGNDLYLPDDFQEKYMKGETLGIFYQNIPMPYSFTGQLIFLSCLDENNNFITCGLIPLTSDKKIDEQNIKQFQLASWAVYAENVKFLGITEMDNSISGILQIGDTATYGKIKISNNNIEYLSQYYNYFDVNNAILLSVTTGNIGSAIRVPRNFATQSQVIDLGDINTNKAEIAKKQSTLYRHTVEFSESGLGYTNRFTAYSEKNMVIDSVQDLITVFGNTKLQCSGTTEGGHGICIGIDVGTTADTTFFVNMTGVKQKISSWYSTQPESTLTITDEVTTM